MKQKKTVELNSIKFLNKNKLSPKRSKSIIFIPINASTYSNSSNVSNSSKNIKNNLNHKYNLALYKCNNLIDPSKHTSIPNTHQPLQL